MSKPLISIVTPSLNAAQYLGRLLQCIEQQTYPAVEHIVVDGLSTDGSRDILQRCDTARHQVIFKQDRSMYEAVNRGITAAHGDILAYLNCDDLYWPTTLTVVAEYFQQHPQCDVLVGDVLSVNPTRQSVFLHVYGKYQHRLSRLAFDQSLGQPSVFFRRRVLQQLGPFDSNLRFVADLEYWMRASQRRLVFHKLNKFLSIDCQVAGNLREKYGADLAAELSRVRQRYFQAIGWKKTFLQKRNYWERIFIDKALEYHADRHFLNSAGVTFDQQRYRDYRTAKQRGVEPILSIDLPYFQFTATKLDGVL